VGVKKHYFQHYSVIYWVTSHYWSCDLWTYNIWWFAAEIILLPHTVTDILHVRCLLELFLLKMHCSLALALHHVSSSTSYSCYWDASFDY